MRKATVNTLRTWIVVGLAALVLPFAVACADSGGGSVPSFDNSERLDSASLSGQDVDELNFAVSDAESVAYRTDASLSDVFEYYANTIEDDGWRIEQRIPDATEAISIISNDAQVATVLMLEGYRAYEGRSLFEDENLNINWDNVADDDRVILISSFTCEENRVEDCLNAVVNQ